MYKDNLLLLNLYKINVKLDIKEKC